MRLEVQGSSQTRLNLIRKNVDQIIREQFSQANFQIRQKTRTIEVWVGNNGCFGKIRSRLEYLFPKSVKIA